MVKLLETATMGKDHQTQAWKGKGRDICCNPVKAVFLWLEPRQELWLEPMKQRLLDCRLKGRKQRKWVSSSLSGQTTINWSDMQAPEVRSYTEEGREWQRTDLEVQAEYTDYMHILPLGNYSRPFVWFKQTEPQVLSSHAFIEVTVFCW